MRRLGAVGGLSAVLLAGLSGCGDLFGDPNGPVELRVHNGSALTFDVVTLATVDGPRTWHDVAPGTTSSYVQVSAAYDKASVAVVVGLDTLRLQVIDYVGEEYLEPGQYTYLLSIADPQSPFPSLVEVLRKDEG